MSFFTPEILTGLLSLGSGALAGMMANNQKLLLASIDYSLNANKQGNANSNDAADRNKGKASFLQRTVGIMVIGVAFLTLAGVALSWAVDFEWIKGVQTSYIYEEARGKFLGIFGSGGTKTKVLTAEGFVIPPYVKYSVISVVNFLFGASVVKLRRI
jgi:hypothetical protein